MNKTTYLLCFQTYRLKNLEEMFDGQKLEENQNNF